MAQKTKSVVFIDAGVEAPSQLIAGVALRAEVLMLSLSENGIQQITSALEARPYVSDVHIVAHGGPGYLKLGNSPLELHTLDHHQDALRRWFAHQPTQQLYLYGCQVAAGDAGAEFLARLRSLTGASIAASTQLVGQAARGGSWQLDTVAGRIPARSLLTPAAALAYPGILVGSDDFAGATVLDTTDSGSNVGFTSELGEPIHDPTVAGLSPELQQELNDSAWWQFTPTTTGELTVSTGGSAIDTVLAVYTGAAVNSLTLIGLNDNASAGVTSSSVTFFASAGTTYFFAVDGVGQAQGNITIALDSPPDITPGQSFTVSEGAVTGSVLGTLDVNETGLTFTIDAGNPDNDGDGVSAFAIDGDGQLLVQDADDLDFEVFDTFYSLQVTADDGGFTDTESVFVSVTDVPEAPIIVDLAASQLVADEGTAITLSGQILDADGTQTVLIQWGDGTSTTVTDDDLVTIDAAGNQTFSANHVYQDDGQFNITVTVSDGGSPPVSDSLAVSVNNVAPVINQGDTLTLTIAEDSSDTFLLSATELSTQDVLTWSILSPAANGTAGFVFPSPTGANQPITYTPDADFSGLDSFQVQVTDDDGGTDVITVEVDVTPLPDAPTDLIVTASSTTINEGDAVTFTGSFADTDLGDSFTVSVDFGDGSDPVTLGNEDLIANPDGTFSFSVDHVFLTETPGVAVTVVDSFGLPASVTVPITVNNVSPTIGGNLSFSVNEDESGSTVLTATDLADDSFTWFIATDATNGTASVSGDPTTASQEITYTPDPNFSGVDEFIVGVGDGDGGFASATVIVGIDPVNDLPTDLSFSILNPGPIDEGSPLTLTGSFEDVDNSAIAAVDDTHTVTIDFGNGNIVTLEDDALTDNTTTTPEFSSSFIYTDDGTFTITVTVTDEAGDSISTTQDVTINNVAPVIVQDANDDGLATAPPVLEDDPDGVTITLSATDVGSDDTLTFDIISQGLNGEVTLGNSSGNITQDFTYIPNANFSGPSDSFTVQVSDGDGGIDTLTITVPVTEVNDAPTFLVNEFTITEGEALTVDSTVLDAIDFETTDDNLLVFTITDLAPGDSFFVAGVPQNTFTRADIFAGTVSFLGNGDEFPPSFTITVTDSNGGTVSQSANIVDFISVNDAPVLTATNVPFTVSEGGTTPVNAQNISATDEESNDQSLTFEITNLVGGEFLVAGTPSTTFTLLEVNQGLVLFSHDGSETAPSYTVTVSDGDLTSEPRDDVPIFGAINDLPELLANTLSLVEGELVTLTTANLSASDAETPANELTFLINNISGGDFLLNGTPLGPVTFTLEDVILGNISFQHDGSNEAPSYDVFVSDGGTPAPGITGPETVMIGSFTAVNDNPIITIPNGPEDPPPFTIAEGGIILLTDANINAEDEAGETPNGELEYTVTDVIGGFFAFSSDTTTAVTSFTQNDIDQLGVVFIHDGGNLPPSYTLTVADGDGGTDVESFVAALTPTNDAPVITTNQITLIEGDVVTLDSSNLLAIDEESSPAELIYTVTNVTGGDFQLEGVTTETFSQQDINDGLVTFVHGGDDTPPAYTVTVTDSGVDGAGALTSPPNDALIAFTAVNDVPDLIAIPFEINEGGTFIITSDEIFASDEETGTPSQLTYTVDSTSNGVFQLEGVDTASFTQQDILDGDLTFVHDDSELAPSFTITVSDNGTPTAETASATVDLIFNNLNDLPVLLNNTLTISEGETVVLTTENLSATDLETTDPDLEFGAFAVTNGAFIVNGVTSDGPTMFTLLDVIEGRVSFEHDGSNVAPSYNLIVADNNDPAGTTGPEAATVIFTPLNDNPIIDEDIPEPPFVIAEGGTVVLNSTNINATDEDGETPSSELQYTVSDVVGGFFALASATTTPIATFSQNDIDQGSIVFTHDGSNVPPGYTLTVTDTDGGSDEQAFVAELTATNDAPSIVTNQLTVAEGETVVLSSNELSAIDEESTPADLAFTVTTITGGEFQLNGVAVTTFTQQNINDGLVAFVHDGLNEAPTYTLTVTDTAVGSTDAITSEPSEAAIAFTAENDTPDLVVTPFTINEGGTVTITPTEIAATDEETQSAADLTYTVDSINNGVFQLNGEDATAFTQQDIVDGSLTFVHDNSELAPGFTITVSDNGTPEAQTATATADLIFNNLNDLPVLLNNTLTLQEGETVVLTTNNLSATDLETIDPDLQFEITDITNGAFIVSGAAFDDTATFTLLNVIQGQVSFAHDGSNVGPTYEVTVSDGNDPIAGTDGPEPVEVFFTPVNDNPSFDENLPDPAFTIGEGNTVVINEGILNATDEDGETPSGDLVYTVLTIEGGFFAESSATTTEITTFTQNQVNQGGIVFTHNGGNLAPSYTLQVADTEDGTATQSFTAELTATNDPPEILVNTLTLTEGDVIVLNSSNLAANDEESTAADLLYTVTSVTGGEFQLDGVTTQTFTQENVNGGLVTFVHNGTDESPTYTVTVTDTPVGDDESITSPPNEADIIFTAVNDAPTLTVNDFTIDEGGIVPIGVTEIAATDEESSLSQLVYTATVTNGTFQLSGTDTTTFSQADVEAGLVTFAHDGSEVGPSFTLTLTDNGNPTPVVITSELIVPTFNAINSVPEFTINQFNIVEGEITPLTLESLAAIDEEDFPSQLSFSINPDTVTGGTFLLNGEPLGDQTFNQASIAFGLVTFEDDGDEIAPTFTITVTDTDDGSAEVEGNVTLIATNDAPTVVANSFSITEGEVLIQNQDSLNLQVTDTESGPAVILYTVSDVAGGNFFLSSNPATPATSFTQQQLDTQQVVFVHDGTETEPAFNFTVTDPDGGVLTFAGAIDEFTLINEFPDAVDDFGLDFTIDENTAAEFITPNVLLNDTDGDGDILVITSFDDTGTQGTLTNNGDGTFTYSAEGLFADLNQNDLVTETFTYTISDGDPVDEGTDTATVTIEILGLSASPDVFFDLEQSLRLESPTATAAVPTNELGGIPLAQLFDEAFYLNENPGVAAGIASGAFGSAFDHFLAFGLDEGRDPSILYNEDFYLAENPGVEAAVAAGTFTSGLEHFLLFGQVEDRDPSALFDQSQYLNDNPDVAADVAAGLFRSGFEHYIEVGVDEVRLPAYALYNEEFYLQENPGVATQVAAGIFADGYEHFVRFGRGEGRNPSILFDQEAYLSVEANAGVAAAVESGAFVSGFDHYQAFGRFEDRVVF